ncbi:ABC transporter permease [Clostridium sp. BNL1100]|uniref:ABC transporter permease n=1 Tax=Clostridium sp. BNL1100 TaxID=755731 RepID=UPI00024A7697|nr:ABC transporter permease [Clostridium sp. BNL1100]AEY64764.1 ABC-2 type transporter [Clostridium sp. BNL1100]
MNTLYIAYYTIKRIMLDKRTNIMKILIPIVAIVILGVALKGSFELSNMDIIKVGYLNLDNGKQGETLVKILKEDKSIKELISLVQVDSVDKAEKMISDDKISSLIFIDKNYTKQIESGEKSSVTIYSSKYSDYKLTVVQNIMDSYVNIVNTNIAVAMVTGKPAEYSSSSSIKEIPISINGNRPKAIDYYAVTILVLSLLSGAAFGCELVGEDYIGIMGKRIKSTPVSPVQQYAGKMIGACLSNFVQGLVMVLFTKFVLKANWGSNIFIILAFTLLVAVFATAIGAMLCIMFNDVNRAGALSSLLVPIFTFIAGGYIKIDFGPIKYLSPNQWAHTAFFNTIYNGDQHLVVTNVLALLIATVVISTVSIILARRRTN